MNEFKSVPKHFLREKVCAASSALRIPSGGTGSRAPHLPLEDYRLVHGLHGDLLRAASGPQAGVWTFLLWATASMVHAPAGIEPRFPQRCDCPEH